MALRIHPMSASRWAHLSTTRLPIDLSQLERAETSERVRAAEDEITRIRACVDALEVRSAVG
jgi:antitoxin component of RelBE/YafQ-DinJ toxin-antitoxin module